MKSMLSASSAVHPCLHSYIMPTGSRLAKKSIFDASKIIYCYYFIRTAGSLNLPVIRSIIQLNQVIMEDY